MKKLISLLLIVTQTAFAGLPPTSATQEWGSKYPQKFATYPWRQVTDQGGVGARVESGNKNQLYNPSFEHTTYSTSWTISKLSGTTFSGAVDTSNYEEGKQSAALTLTSATGEIYQDSTASTQTNNIPMVAGCAVKTTLTDVKVCARSNGADLSSYCTTVTSGGNWTFVVTPTFPGPSDGTSIGVGVENASSESGTFNVDDCFVGVATSPQTASPAVGFAATDSTPATFTYSNFTVSASAMQEKRFGERACYSGTLTTSGGSGSAAALIMPAGRTLDTSKLSSLGNFLGMAFPATGSTNAIFASGVSFAIFFDGSTTDRVFFSFKYATSTFAKALGTDIVFSQPMTVDFCVPVAGWASNVQVAPTATYWASAYAVNAGRVTGSAPTALGQYRSYLRNSSASTYTETNGSPTATPTNADGFRIYHGGAWTAADTNNNPTKYEIYIGLNKNYKIYWYASAGRTGFVDTTPQNFFQTTNQTIDYGYVSNYDPTTGILTLASPLASNNWRQSHNSGVDTAGGNVNNVYFDVKVSDNALFVASQVTGPGSVTNSSPTISDHFERAMISTVCTSGTCTLTNNTPGISSIGWNSTGDYTVSFGTSTYSAPPTCDVGSLGAGAAFGVCRVSGVPSTSTATVDCRNLSNSQQNDAFTIKCSGPR